jgi:uncharacterized protein YbjT (DUF2867 family)
MTAIIIGATGATGRDLVDLLLQDTAFDAIHVFVRRPLAISDPMIETHLVDFDQIDSWKSGIRGDVLFSCLGTTLRAAGSQEAQWKVDYDYQFNFAKAAHENGVPTLVLMSSMGANPQSSVFYMKMKGQLEEAVKLLGFSNTIIVRPPSLIRRNSDRWGEKVGVMALKMLNKVGILRSMKPLSTEAVARAMLTCSLHMKGQQVVESRELRMLAGE